MAKVEIKLKDRAGGGIEMLCAPNPFDIVQKTQDGTVKNSAAETYALKVVNVMNELVKDGSYNYRAVTLREITITIEDTPRGAVHTQFEPSLRQIAEMIGVGIVPPSPVQRLARKVAVGLVALSDSTSQSRATLADMLTSSSSRLPS